MGEDKGREISKIDENHQQITKHKRICIEKNPYILVYYNEIDKNHNKYQNLRESREK